MKSFLLVPLLAAASFAAPTGNTAAAEDVKKDIVFRCLPSADLHVLKDNTKPLYICRGEGRVLALAFDSQIPKDDKELYVVLEPETLKKLGEAIVAREARTILGGGSGSAATSNSGSFSLGLNPLGVLQPGPTPLVSLSGASAHSHAASGGIGGILG